MKGKAKDVKGGGYHLYCLVQRVVGQLLMLLRGHCDAQTRRVPVQLSLTLCEPFTGGIRLRSLDMWKTA